jgi:septal ring factor EnvC (AmiA/AmiB activator)
MNTGLRIACAASTAALVLPLAPTAAIAADPCASRSDIRMQVSEFVHTLRDDVPSRPARSATVDALVETVATFRGANADTAAQRSALTDQIVALAQQLKAADTAAERKALALEIKALNEQRDRGGITGAERADLRQSLAALKNALVNSTDTAAEGQAVADFVRALVTQLACHPQ